MTSCSWWRTPFRRKWKYPRVGKRIHLPTETTTWSRHNSDSRWNMVTSTPSGTNQGTWTVASSSKTRSPRWSRRTTIRGSRAITTTNRKATESTKNIWRMIWEGTWPILIWRISRKQISYKGTQTWSFACLSSPRNPEDKSLTRPVNPGNKMWCTACGRSIRYTAESTKVEKAQATNSDECNEKEIHLTMYDVYKWKN